MRQRIQQAILNLIPHRFRDDRGASMLEWTMLAAGVVIPGWVIIKMGLSALAGHYGLVTTLNQMPFP